MSRHTWEAVKIDRPEEVEELYAVFWEFREVLVDHVQSALKDTLHDKRNLVLHQGLHHVSQAVAAQRLRT